MIRWILLLQQFYFEVNDRKECKNQVENYLSHLDSNKEKLGEILINKFFTKKLVMTYFVSVEPWYVDYLNYVVCGLLPDDRNIPKENDSSMM